MAIEGGKRKMGYLTVTERAARQRKRDDLKAARDAASRNEIIEAAQARIAAAKAEGLPLLDLAPAMAKARIERAARTDPPFSPREFLGRAQIRMPLIERLIGRGDLPPRAQDAADEIRMVSETSSAGGVVSAVDWNTTGTGGGFAPAFPSGSGHSALAELIQRLCLGPWERDMLANPPKDGRDRPIASALLVVKAAVLQGPPLHDLERLGGLRNGQAKRVIREGLARYSTLEELRQTRGKGRKAEV